MVGNSEGGLRSTYKIWALGRKELFTGKKYKGEQYNETKENLVQVSAKLLTVRCSVLCYGLLGQVAVVQCLAHLKLDQIRHWKINNKEQSHGGRKMNWKPQVVATNLKIPCYHSTYIKPRKRDVFLYSCKVKRFDCAICSNHVLAEMKGKVRIPVSLILLL